MQHCWPTFQSDGYVEKSTGERPFTLCEFCLEPSNSVIMTDIYDTPRERQCSEPVLVPDSLTTTLINSQQQPAPSHSSGYESTFGNELSPNTTGWTLGSFRNFFSISFSNFFYFRYQ
jgi:hypothetical protein